MKAPRLRSAFAVLLVGFALVGCTDDRPDSGRRDVAVLDVEQQQILLPLDEFVLSEREGRLVGHVNAQRIAQCLHDHGLPYPEADRDWRSEDLTHNRIFGPWSLDWVAEHGYEYPSTVQAQAVVDAVAQLPAEFSVALQGCVESTELLPVLTLYDEPNLAARGSMESYLAAQTEGEWRTAIGEWRTCLADRGLSIEEAVDVFVPDLPEGQEAQIRAAIADVECKEEVDLVQRLGDVMAKEQAEFISAHEAALEQLKSDKDDILSRARAELGSSE